LQRELRKLGKSVNHKRIHRLWRAAGLCIAPRRRHRKRIRSGKPATALVADRPGAVWCLDFLEERTIHHQKLRILCISDEFTREWMTVEVGTHFLAERVVAVLEKLMRERDVPGALRMDNGPEFIALVLRGMCHRWGVNPAYIDPAKPWQNGFAEAFHSRLRDEFLDGELFYGVRDAKIRLKAWRTYFNEERLHSSLGYLTPVEFREAWEAAQRELSDGQQEGGEDREQ
jgi:transposase InsO family protein